MSPEIAKQQALERLYETNINCQGESMQIVNYHSAKDIDIRFMQTNNIIYHQSYSNFKKGALKDYYLPTFYDVGIVGNSKIYNANGEKTLAFKHWEYMLKRCYYKLDLQRYPTYTHCEVCNEWLNLSNFEVWVKNNYYQCGNEKMCLDKDILFKNNKIYSPDTTIFIPERINILFTKTNAARGKYPIGVYYKQKNKKFVAQVSKLTDEQSNTKQQEHIGLYNTPEDAFKAYKAAKENYIKEVADYYLNKYPHFPRRIYDALYSYQVEITD